MQRNMVRAMLLAISLLLLVAIPVAAQSDDEGWSFSSTDDSVLIAAQQDIAVGPTESSDGLVVLESTAVVEGTVESLLAVDSDVTVTGASAQVERIFTIAGNLTVDGGATVGEIFYAGTELAVDETTATVTGDIVNAQEEIVGALAAVVAVLIVLLIFIAIGAFIAALAMTLLVIAFGTEQTRHAAGDVRVAREVAVDLEAERVHAGQQLPTGPGAGIVEDLGDEGRQGVGHEDLLEEAQQDQVHPRLHLPPRDRPRRRHLG